MRGITKAYIIAYYRREYHLKGAELAELQRDLASMTLPQARQWFRLHNEF